MDTVALNSGVATTVADSDLVTVCDSGGALKPVSFANLMAAVRGAISIGGRNLILDSDTPLSGTYGLGTYHLSETLQAGISYILTLYGVTIGEGKQSFIQIWNKGGNNFLFNCEKIAEGVYQGRFTPLASHDASKLKELNIHSMPKTVTTITSITSAKLEEGNIATAWSPAPEDIASGSCGGGNCKILKYLQFNRERRPAC